MSDLPQISKAEFEVIKIIWKHVPMGILFFFELPLDYYSKY